MATESPTVYIETYGCQMNVSDSELMLGRLAEYGYRESAAHYTDAREKATGKRAPFWFVVVEKDAPHMVAMYQLTEADIAFGAERIAEAKRLFAECEASGEWPAYSPEVETLTMPRWAAA